MDIGKAFTDTWDIYVKNFVNIILAGIVAMILSILVVPMVGFQMMFVKAKRGGAPVLNDVFVPFGKFLDLLLGALCIGIVLFLAIVPSMLFYLLNWNFLGMILLLGGIALDIYLGVSWMFALLLIYDKGLSIGDSLKASKELVAKNNFWMHLLLVILAGIIGGIGNIFWGIGSILTMPIGVGAIACVYADEAK